MKKEPKKIPNYIDVKNYLINELGVDRSVVKQILEEHVREMIGKRIERIMDETWVRNIIRSKFNEVIKEVYPGRYKIGGQSDYLSDKIENMINQEIKRQITSRIKFQEVNISVGVK